MKNDLLTIKNIIICCIIVICIFTFYINKKYCIIVFPSEKGVGYWEKTSEMIIPRKNHSSVLLNNGSVLLVGGNSGGSNYLKAAEIYLPEKNKFIKAGDVNCTGNIVPVKIDNRIVIIGCRNGIIEEYDPVKKRFSALHKNSLKFDKSGMSTNFLILKDGNIFLYDSDTPKIYNPITNISFVTSKVNLQRFRTSFVEINQNILISGGYILDSQNTLTKTIELYNRKNNTYKIIGEMQIPRHNHSIVALSDDKILILGGRGNPKEDYLDSQVFKNNINPSILRNFGGKKAFFKDLLQDIELYDLKTNKSKIIGKLNYSIGDDLVLNFISDGYILVSNGIGKLDELIDIKNFKIYPVKPYTKMCSCNAVNISKNEVLVTGLCCGKSRCNSAKKFVYK